MFPTKRKEGNDLRSFLPCLSDPTDEVQGIGVSLSSLDLCSNSLNGVWEGSSPLINRLLLTIQIEFPLFYRFQTLDDSLLSRVETVRVFIKSVYCLLFRVVEVWSFLGSRRDDAAGTRSGRPYSPCLQK